MIYFNRVINSVLIILIIFILSKLIQRPIWIDEATLLKNLINETDLFSYLKPLKYYDQAQPVIISLLYNFIVNNITYETIFLRTIILTINLLILYPLILNTFNNKNQLIALLLTLSITLSIGYYLTEIKHYAFEISASGLIIYLYILYDSKKISLYTYIYGISLINIIGFSTIILGSIFITYTIIKEKKLELNAKTLIAILFYIIITLIIYFQIQIITAFQLNNTDRYEINGIINNIKNILTTLIFSFGKWNFITLITLVLYGLIQENKLYKDLSRVFIITFISIIILKILNIYPAINIRHLMWFSIFGLYLNIIGINCIYENVKKQKKLVLTIILTPILIQITDTLYRVNLNLIPNLTSNENLYKKLSKLDSSDILVYPYAQPSLEYYMLINKELNKHNYIGLENYLSGVEDHGNLLILSKKIDLLFTKIPETPFYFLISHQSPLHSEKLPNHQKARELLLLNKFTEKNCFYQSIFKQVNVEILRMDCRL